MCWYGLLLLSSKYSIEVFFYFDHFYLLLWLNLTTTICKSFSKFTLGSNSSIKFGCFFKLLMIKIYYEYEIF